MAGWLAFGATTGSSSGNTDFIVKHLIIKNKHIQYYDSYNMWSIFPQADATNWGIDWEGPVAEPDPVAVVQVLPVHSDLQQTIEEHLRGTIDPYMTSDVFGMDLYWQALSLVAQLHLPD